MKCLKAYDIVSDNYKIILAADESEWGYHFTCDSAAEVEATLRGWFKTTKLKECHGAAKPVWVYRPNLW